jgi:type I restriction enzyme R subunit
MLRKGKEYQKPEDYLVSFARFVQENKAQIEAIRILLEKPKEWKTGVLNDLRKKLTINDFSEKELQKAHKLVYHKDLADIISMVKHAAKEEEPIFTAEERVGKALKKVMSGKSFNDEQRNWLGLIRQHLITNLTIELADFENAPIFERQGGKGRAEKVFEDKLESLISEINCAIAA